MKKPRGNAARERQKTTYEERTKKLSRDHAASVVKDRSLRVTLARASEKRGRRPEKSEANRRGRQRKREGRV